ncbi:MAG: AmmeMemoRadiSam system protein B [Ignavibacteria bacterium CG_4_8_14_3_um_filter_37_9]|nr:MAG: AmmeMemoRadiSam system protein B [Ignavibacteria bacterium CG_4_8_14_3_um_filter_37_9]
MKENRPPYFAGYFYPEKPGVLQAQIQKMLETAKNDFLFPNLHTIIAPHAGYAYSGLTAAYGYNAINGKKYSTVIILSPSHHEYFAGISIYDGDAYETPLGLVPVNHDVSELLVKGSKRIFRGKEGHREEHAIEVQLPFLQTVLNDFTIVPVVMGDQNEVYVEALAESLADVLNDETLVVVSSDLSHYHSQQKAELMDAKIAGYIEALDYNGLMRDLNSGKSEACGGGLILSVLKAIEQKQNKAKVIHRTTSGEVSLDYQQVVGYLSAAIYS